MMIHKEILLRIISHLGPINTQQSSENLTNISQINYDITFRDIFLLAIGEFGAVLAIIIKESIQHVILKRTVLWQLAAYMETFKLNLLNEPKLYVVYDNAKVRYDKLTKAAIGGKNNFSNEYFSQKESTKKLRDQILSEIKNAFEKYELDGKSDLKNGMLNVAKKGFEYKRLLLIDSKTFISDKDAALLGKTIASQVVSFRTSLHEVYLSFELIFEIINNDEMKNSDFIPKLVEQIFVQGESALTSYIRLENSVERSIKKSLFGLMIETFI